MLIDPLTGAQTVTVGARQSRPNLPEGECPFCVGGLEAPEPYDVRAFVNRFPSMPDDRCEVVLYTPQHDASLASLGLDGARRVVDLWAERSEALGAREDVAYVLVFENRGAEVGATIAHPHGQIYAFDVVPPAPATERDLMADRPARQDDRHVTSVGAWSAWTARASTWPIDLRIAGDAAAPDLPSLDPHARDDLAALLVDVAGRIDGQYGRPLPYMLWFHQRPFDGREWHGPPLHAHLVSPWRDDGVARFVAAGELGSGVFFNPVPPEGRGRGVAISVGVIVARAPGRVNLIGDHTDYTGGLVMPMAIDRWTEVRGERGGNDVLLHSSDAAEPAVIPIGIDEPRSVEPDWARYVAGVVAELRPSTGFEGNVSTTIPLGAGLSSSAALEVAVALALGADGSALDIARLCQAAEQRASGVPCGIMDQLASTGGVEGAALAIDCHDLTVSPVSIPDGLDVIVVDTGERRSLASSAYGDRVRACEAAERIIGPLRDATIEQVHEIADPTVRARARHVISENERVRGFAEAIRAGAFADAGLMMVDSHTSLRDDYEVSTPGLDRAAAELRARPGVYGARLTGAGFGGCVVALADAGSVRDVGWIVRPVGGATVTAD